MAVNAAMRRIKLTGDDNDVASLQGITLLHAVIAITTTLTSAASVKIYDASTATGDEVVEIHANTADATNFEKTFGVVFAYPVKLFTDVSVDVTNCICYLYVS